VATIFTRIIDGEIPGIFVWKDAQAVAFLSINPINRGHTLVVPRAEVDHWLDLEPALAAHLTSVAQAIGKAQERAFGSRRVGLIIAGFEVPHTHLHVIPADTMADLDFANAAAQPDFDALAVAAVAIRTALRELGYAQVAD
jgi:histidine triad (HIT) family protein